MHFSLLVFRVVNAAIRGLWAFALLVSAAWPAQAEFSIYDTETYDLNALGVPRFININYIDLRKITQISKFRSSAGHDYSDSTQFSTDAMRIVGLPFETCRSMKHYFGQPDTSTELRSPVSGVVSRIFGEEQGGLQLHITSDVQPAFTIIIFHVVSATPFAVGDRITEGQLLGHHVGTWTTSDIAVAVHTPTGYHLISYFETLTEAAFAPFKAAGIASPEQLIVPRAERDAAPYTCVGTSFGGGYNAADYVNFSGGAASQTITVNTLFASSYHLGDPPLAVDVTASSGFPVSLSSNTLKVCRTDGKTVIWRRRGTCTVTFTQDGDGNTFAAQPVQRSSTVLPFGAPLPGPPRLGAVFPPSDNGSQSYLRFINRFGSGKVTLSLTNAATGQAVVRWTSPTIAPNSSPQYSIAEIESAAPAGFVRPGLYGLKIEPETTLGDAYLQHVLYHPADGTLTNLSTCDYGVTVNPGVIGNVHTSRLGATGFPSWLVIHNMSGYDFVNEFLDVYDAGTGIKLGNYLHTPPLLRNSSALVTMTAVEQKTQIAPGTRNHYLMYPLYSSPAGYVQHLVFNEYAGVITDMTTVCALNGLSTTTPGVPLRGGMLYSGGQTASQSFLRLYNANTFAGTVTVTLYDAATGATQGEWTSPSLAPNSELQMAVGAIEDAIGKPRRDNYQFKIDTDIDGEFQHVLWRVADGTLTNLSTCPGAVDADPSALMGVHSSRVGAGGYPSSVVVNNTGTAAAAVTLGVFDARDGSRLGTFTTVSIPGGGQAMLDVVAVEAGAGITPAADQYHYIVKAEGAFTGFLQHLVNNQRSGVITDMTTVCEM